MLRTRAAAVSVVVLSMALCLCVGCKSSDASKSGSSGNSGAVTTTAAAKNPLEMLPEDVNLVMHLDMDGLVGSELYRSAYERFGDEMLPPTPQYAEFLEATGFDVQRDLRGVTFAGIAALDGGAESVFMVIDGDFDRKKMEARLEEMEGVTIGSHAGMTTFETTVAGDSGPPPTLAWLDDNTMIVATTPDFPRFVETIKGKQPNASKSDLAGMVSGQTAQVYAAMLVPHPEAGVSEDADGGMLGALQQQMQSLQTISFSLEANIGLDLQIHAAADSAESAQGMFEMFNGYLSMGKMMAASNPELSQVVNRMKLVQLSSDIKLSVTVTNAELMAALEKSQTTSTASAIGG